MPRRGPFDIIRTPTWQVQDYGYPSYRFSRTTDCNEDDLRTGYARNQALGWHKEENDHTSSRQAMISLAQNRVSYYDWAYHRG